MYNLKLGKLSNCSSKPSVGAPHGVNVQCKVGRILQLNVLRGGLLGVFAYLVYF